MLYIYVSCSSSLSSGDNINAFSVSGELLPKQQIPISSDTVTGHIGANGDSWMTLQVARSSSQNIGCCTCFYIQFSISQFYQTEKQTVLINGTSNNLFSFDLDIPAGYMACALRYLSITSPNAACVISSYRLGDSQLNINVRNTSGSQVTAEVEASILCLKLN